MSISSGEDGAPSKPPSIVSGDTETAVLYGGPVVEHEKDEAADTEDFGCHWDGPNDPQNPMNWSSFRQWLTIGLVTLSGFNAYEALQLVCFVA